MGDAADSQCIERRPSLLVTPFRDVTKQMADVPPASARYSSDFLICDYGVFDGLLVDVFRVAPEFSLLLQQAFASFTALSLIWCATDIRLSMPGGIIMPRKGQGLLKTMAVVGGYISWRIRQAVLPFVRVYGQWVEERIIPLVSQLTVMADAVEQQAYHELMSQPVGEDYYGDGSEEAEHAFDVGLSFYQNITAMYQGTLNLFAAGLFHVIEQQLTDLTKDGSIDIEGPDTKLQNVIDWYKRHFDADFELFPSWPLIEELRLVANTTKHAEGPSAAKLRSIRAQLFQNPLLRKVDPQTLIIHKSVNLPLGGDGLYVTGDDFRNYHKAGEGLFDWLVKHFEAHSDEYYPL